MFRKILVAEDFDSINIALVQTLQTLDIDTIEYTKYCDDALLKYKKSLADTNPFDLVITDLSFVQDYREVAIASGNQLIDALRALNPNVKILVYSVENRAHNIRLLFEEKNINGYVHKSRNSISQLKTAITHIYNGSNYISPELEHVLHKQNNLEIDHYDISLLQYLAQGKSIDDMATTFLQLNIKPNSKSSIEKRVARLKDLFKANNNIHLIAIVKDLGII